MVLMILYSSWDPQALSAVLLPQRHVVSAYGPISNCFSNTNFLSNERMQFIDIIFFFKVFTYLFYLFGHFVKRMANHCIVSNVTLKNYSLILLYIKLLSSVFSIIVVAVIEIIIITIP